MEVTFEEARAHLGIETQRQWNDRAIGRTTPALFGLYSLVVLMAHALLQGEARAVRPAAWYAKVRPTFSDALPVVRRELWDSCHFSMSESHADMIKIPRSVFERLTDTVCYAGTLCLEFGSSVAHYTARYANNFLEQSHHAVKRRIRPMLGFKRFNSAARFCHAHDEVRHFLRLSPSTHRPTILRWQCQLHHHKFSLLREMLVGRIASLLSLLRPCSPLLE